MPAPFSELELRFHAELAESSYEATLEAFDARGESLARISRSDIPPHWLEGGLALVSSSGEVTETSAPPGEIRETGWQGKSGTDRGGTVRFWFRDWKVSGSKIVPREELAFGPILFAMHTLSRNVLNLTAQMAPLGPSGPSGNASPEVFLEVDTGGTWTSVAETTIDPDARTARFRVTDWDDTRDTPYRVRYDLTTRSHAYEGTIRKDPIDKERIIIAAFTGNNDVGFPHADIVEHVRHFGPDFLAYTGDNIYERVGEYGIQEEPVETAILDYLRKWYLFGWEYQELLKDIPAVALPDDHDVYHGNVWGAGGKRADGSGQTGQDSGGYVMPARFVKAVERTQTSNMLAPYDPTPVEQDIGVYYTSLLYGGVSFAIVEDRKWKSAPKVMLPSAGIVNGWPQSPAYNAASDGDVTGARLLGERQLEFLDARAADWSGGAWMKAVISQSIFANVATLSRGTLSGAVTPTLTVMAPGEYAEGELPVQDHDSNGWPQSGRNKALRAMRKGFAFHIAGDQHLGSTIQYGIDTWGDAGWALSVPSVANIWPRRWFPPEPGGNHQDGTPRYTGDYLDGFGNKMTVHAVSNPTANGVEPTAIHHRAPGYGIVTLDRDTREITFANWPRFVDPSEPDAKPYQGWPISFDQRDNGFPGEGWRLETIETEIDDPVIQIVADASGEVVYTYRIQGRSFEPRVFESGVYTVRVTDPDSGYVEIYSAMEATRSP